MQSQGSGRTGTAKERDNKKERVLRNATKERCSGTTEKYRPPHSALRARKKKKREMRRERERRQQGE